jgi:hypothetical protein
MIEISSKAWSAEADRTSLASARKRFEGHSYGEFTELASSICRDHLNYIKLIEDEFGHLPCAAFTVGSAAR